MAAARRCLQLLALMLSAILAVSPVGCGKQNSGTEKRDLTLEVALYPYVPDAAKFKEAVSNAWERRQTNAKLHFVDWNCYESDPDPKIDVFVFDGVYLTSFVEGGYLLPIPEDKVEKGSDMFSFAIEGCKNNGELYALPQLLCANYLFTRKDDPALSGATDIMVLYDILGDREVNSVMPEKNEGLLIGLSSTTKTMLYLDALIDGRGSYTDYSELPETSNLSDGALAQLRALRKMGGADQVDYRPADGDRFARARWFAEGKGRAYIGFSESMAAMGGLRGQSGRAPSILRNREKRPVVLHRHGRHSLGYRRR